MQITWQIIEEWRGRNRAFWRNCWGIKGQRDVPFPPLKPRKFTTITSDSNYLLNRPQNQIIFRHLKRRSKQTNKHFLIIFIAGTLPLVPISAFITIVLFHMKPLSHQPLWEYVSANTIRAQSYKNQFEKHRHKLGPKELAPNMCKFRHIPVCDKTV